MTLKPEVVGPIPEATIHTARAAFPKGSVVIKLRDEFGSLYHDELDTMLARFQERGLVKSRGKQRTDSTHVLAAVHDLSLVAVLRGDSGATE